MATTDAVAANKIDLEIVTPRGRALSALVDEVTAPSVAGEFGVLPGHLPLLAALRCGIVSYREGGDTKRVAVGSGFAEAGANKLLILTDEYTERDKIDPVLVRKELAEVDEKIAKLENAPIAADAKPANSTGGVKGAGDAGALKLLIARENWLAVQLELYGDPPPATMRPFEEFGPPPPPPEDEVPSSDDAAK
jgi:F-type H+-transporting ATPase subunit epsilon